MNVIESNVLTSVGGGMIGAPAGSILLSASGESRDSCGQIQVGYSGGVTVSGSVEAVINCASDIGSAIQNTAQDISNWWN